MVKIVALDYDGTLVDTFGGSSLFRTLKLFFFRSLRPLYLFGEIVEALLCIRRRLHEGAETFIEGIEGDKTMMVGVVTDRSLFSFVVSARRAGLPISLLHFVHARRSMLDWLVRARVPAYVIIVNTPSVSYKKNAAAVFTEFCLFLGAEPDEVLFVGDDERNRRTADSCGFVFFQVSRTCPDFREVARVIERQMSPVPPMHA